MADKSEFPHPTQEQLPEIGQVLAKIPTGLFILTACHEDRRIGMLTSLVQQVCFSPPAIVVSVAKGRAIMPLISESRRFALCQIGPEDKTTVRKFSSPPTSSEDPFLGVSLIKPMLPDLPILTQSLGYIECELSCHMDVEGDHDLFVGNVKHGKLLRQDGEPLVRVRDDGFDY